MRDNVIELKFDKTISGLAGNDFGYEEFKKQIRDKFNYEANNIIVFPDTIQKVAISFIQGMFKDILEKIDKNIVENYITIQSSSEQLTKKIVDNIKF